MLGITGAKSTTAQALIELARSHDMIHRASILDMPIDLNRYFIATGYLKGKQLAGLSVGCSFMTWNLNYAAVGALCDRIIAVNDDARIVVMGSESGFAGSYDMAYAGAKAALHLYIETKRLRTPDQLLVALAPHIIADSGMTERRSDYAETMQRGAGTRIGRWITAAEVAKVAHWCLYEAPVFISNSIIRLEGGNAG